MGGLVRGQGLGGGENEKFEVVFFVCLFFDVEVVFWYLPGWVKRLLIIQISDIKEREAQSVILLPHPLFLTFLCCHNFPMYFSDHLIKYFEKQAGQRLEETYANTAEHIFLPDTHFQPAICSLSAKCLEPCFLSFSQALLWVPWNPVLFPSPWKNNGLELTSNHCIISSHFRCYDKVTELLKDLGYIWSVMCHLFSFTSWLFTCHPAAL